MNSKLNLYSNSTFYKHVLHYIYTKYSDQIKSFEYIAESTIKPYEYIYRKTCYPTVKVCNPTDINIDIKYGDHIINFDLTTLKENEIPVKILVPGLGCNSSPEEAILKQIKLKGDSNELLIKFVDEAKKYCEDQIKLSKKSEKKTIKVNMWRKEYWNLLFKSPKRPIDTLYLKEGQKEELLKNVEKFFNEDTRADYLEHGIPYKSVFMLYGPPGTGKTSSINTIASYFDCDVYVIPISKELTDYGLIDAISYLEEKEEKKRIIVIEDIDSIFTNRKKGDDDNGITLQGLLNCFDGFSCVEGTLLFITANKPEVIDNALFRSCRVDHKFELGYADEYQTKCIFERMSPKKDKEIFNKFYKMIKNKEYTTAMLQEFLFFNREKETIFDIMDEFYDIIENNKPGHFEKKSEKHMYN
jgi:SpoVK/Ycf46/Vps4 family AAA+-type ATPase